VERQLKRIQSSAGVDAVLADGLEAGLLPSSVLDAPKGIALDTVGDLYVANTGGDAIVGLNVAQPSFSFGSVAVGSTSASQTIYLGNTGNSALTLSAAPALDPGDTTFTLGSGTCANGTTLAPESMCTVVVAFKPTTTATATGTITLTDNAGGGTQTISLSGTGTTSSVLFSSTGHGFGSLSDGQSATFGVKVTNN
jgi:hypothetical protein